MYQMYPKNAIRYHLRHCCYSNNNVVERHSICSVQLLRPGDFVGHFQYFVKENEAFNDVFSESIEDIEWNDGWSEVSKLCCIGDDDFVKGLEDIDWNKNWSKVSEFCGSDSLCCIDLEAKKNVCTPSIEAYSRSSCRFQIIMLSRRNMGIVLRIPRNTFQDAQAGVLAYLKHGAMRNRDLCY